MATHEGVLAHHFDDLEQQRGAARLGIWIFLVTEILFFGGVFCAYAAYRHWYPAEFAAASSQLNVFIASINSLVLLASSLTITLAIHAAQEGRRSSLNWNLIITAILGTLFLVLKGMEYLDDWHENLVPGTSHFNAAEWEEKGLSPGRVQLFLMFYYIMTGLHVVHLTVGIGLVIWMWVRARRGLIPPEGYMQVEVTSLYWHFVDLVWLFLVPLLYLAGPHSLAQFGEQAKHLFGM